VRWHSPSGKTKVNRLQLCSVGSVEALEVRGHRPAGGRAGLGCHLVLMYLTYQQGSRRLCLPERRPTQPARPQGLAKNLVTRAFPEYERPDYLTSAEFFKFTPSEEFLTLPGDISRTEFRLVRARLPRPPRARSCAFTGDARSAVASTLFQSPQHVTVTTLFSVPTSTWWQARQCQPKQWGWPCGIGLGYRRGSRGRATRWWRTTGGSTRCWSASWARSATPRARCWSRCGPAA